tara:strand:- start:173 stop:571 length:399 start_codon:yes stop_codon:yes gene_type:complete
MKNILLLSALILFSCSKDSEEEVAVKPGDEIIGTHQIIPNPDNENEFSEWMGEVDLGSTITFNNNYKGSYNITRGTEDSRIIRNFDWSFDGQRWNLIEEELGQWTVSFFSHYEMRVDNANRNGLPRAKFFFK